MIIWLFSLTSGPLALSVTLVKTLTADASADLRSLTIASLAFSASHGLLTLALFKPLALWLATLKSSLHLRYQQLVLKTLKLPPFHSPLEPTHSALHLPPLLRPDNVREKPAASKQEYLQIVQKRRLEHELDHIKVRSSMLLRSFAADGREFDLQYPRFVYRVSSSLYMQVADYAKAFLLSVDEKLLYESEVKG